MSSFDDLQRKIVEDPTSFVVVLGAGASVPAGLPSWASLKNKLYDALPEVFVPSEELADIQKYINDSRDLWDAFTRLKQKLGKLKYEKIIMQSLDCGGRKVPELYRQIWQLNVSGIVNFNIDKFAIDSYSSLNGRAVDFATGNEPHKFGNFCTSSDKFVFHPHGILSDTKSWVFTTAERRALYRNPDFKKMMSAIFNAKNLLIIGFNVQEWNFQQLIKDCGITRKLNGFHNYYFCPNTTPNMQKSLDKLGLSVIPYKPHSEKHSEINDRLSDILNYKSVDVVLPTIYRGKVYSEAEIPSEEDCYKYTVDQLRNILNGVVAGIIPVDTVPSNEQLINLENFYNNYITQLHRAWLVNPKNPSTAKVYGYTTTDFIGNGAFGSVFEAEDKDKNRYALKVLSQEVKDSVAYLSCFRRGIRSMHILTEKNIEGMVKIRDSYEIPACIIMDLVDGITLRTAIDKHFLKRLEVKLDVLGKISKIIHSAHQLEERILHRDLKPENIMLENCFSERDFDDPSDSPVVKVLDFDLSWHRGATERTITFGAVSQGFMAPEQVDMSADRSLARSTAVDIYSLGMLAYYVLTGSNPAPNESQFESFGEQLYKLLDSRYQYNWKCIPEYLCDTILRTTKREPLDRMPLDVFIHNLDTAREIYLNRELPNTHPLILRELKERLGECANCEISDFGQTITLDYIALSKRIIISRISQRRKIILSVIIERYTTDSDRRDSIAKYLKSMADRALSHVDGKLFRLSWEDSLNSSILIHLEADLPEKVGLQYIQAISSNILEVRQYFASQEG